MAVKQTKGLAVKEFLWSSGKTKNMNELMTE